MITFLKYLQLKPLALIAKMAQGFIVGFIKKRKKEKLSVF